MKGLWGVLLIGAALFLLGGGRDGGLGINPAAAQTPPDCTNGDCPPPPPDCTNGDCPPPPPDCTNGDCPPPEPTDDCCCVGDNQPGDNRVCCCPNDSRDAMTCRLSLVLATGYPDEWHQTLAQESLEGKRPRGCDILMAKYCDPPEEEVCSWQRGKRVCQRILKAQCKILDQVCAYRFCGPTWFPFDAPAPDKAGCGWWDQIYHCRQK